MYLDAIICRCLEIAFLKNLFKFIGVPHYHVFLDSLKLVSWVHKTHHWDFISVPNNFWHQYLQVVHWFNVICPNVPPVYRGP
ncbi:hypothetical protein DPMN_066934 [Dreissena polymorpha]|uniref:Uncharacterized protein n=1 Tax=Dreissena polymorpha TaxID=45954 RepID=A0A9D3YYR4_DREPO|nr:hypothetical protein DPMN_066934 [Dreissena polymorpha]